MDISFLPNRPAVSFGARRPQPAPVAASLPSLRNGPATDVFFSGRKAFQYPAELNMVHKLVSLGTDPATRNRVGFRVSRHFSPDGKDHDTTYAQMLDKIQRTAAGFRKMGLDGKRIAVAETNTLDYLSTYYGGLAVGATMLPINLLAMQDEYTKIANLAHMVGGTQSDAYVFGSDSLFKPMYGFQKILSLRKPLLRNVAERYAQGLPAKNPLHKLLYKVLDKSMREKVAEGVHKLQQSGVTVTEAHRAELLAQAKSDFATLFERLPQNLRLITPEDKSKMRRLKPLSVGDMALNPKPDSISDVIFTSGTSGNPKGVALTHQNLVFTATSLNQAVENILKPDDVMLVGLPLFHIFGKAVQLTGIYRGTQMVMLPSLRAAIADLDKVSQTIRDYKVTVLPSVPIFLEKLVAHANSHPQTRQALQQIRVVISGGAPLKKETYDALKAINPHMQILEGYGSSEGGINMLNMTGEPGFVGSELPGVEVKMIETDTRHAFYGASKMSGEGEILVRSPGVSPGYVAGTLDEGETGDEHGLVSLSDKDGWYHTGDQGNRQTRLRAGAKPGDFGSLVLGPMQIIGRESNFIKDSGGERRDPGEFEKAVRTAEPRVLDAMAVPYRPDRETEKSVVVAVTEDPRLGEEDIKQAMGRMVESGKLAGALIPKHIIVLRRSSLPEAFKNDFKREAGYKVARDFVSQAVAQGLVDLQDKTTAQREQTRVQDAQALQTFAENYRYHG